MPRVTRKPNLQLKNIVLEETNDGRDIVRYLKSVFIDIEDAHTLFGLSHKDYTRTHKIASARILARLGLEEGRRYLDWNYVQTPFRRVHPEDENDPPKREMAKATADLYRLVKKKTNDGSDIMIHFVEVMKGYHPEYKPYLRMAAAKELVRQIEFDYDDEPAPSRPDEPASPEPVPIDEPTHEHHCDDAPETVRQPAVSLAAIQREIHSEKGSAPYRDYASGRCAPQAESIYQSIIRHAADQPDIESATRQAENLIADFNRFVADQDPEHQPVSVPGDLIARSLDRRMNDPENCVFDPAEYYDLDRDDFYYCICQSCDDCDELTYFFRFMRELEEETDFLYEDP